MMSGRGDVHTLNRCFERGHPRRFAKHLLWLRFYHQQCMDFLALVEWG